VIDERLEDATTDGLFLYPRLAHCAMRFALVRKSAHIPQLIEPKSLPSLALGLCSVVTPVLFAYFDSLDPKAKYFWVVEQIVVSFVKYYDWEDWGIYTTFGRGVALTQGFE